MRYDFTMAYYNLIVYDESKTYLFHFYVVPRGLD